MLIEELARAKVNLTLQVLGRRPDGYHELASLVAFASCGDVVTLDAGKPVNVTVGGPFGGSLASEYLIGNTLQLLAEREPKLTLGAVHLEKRLPVAAGIAGGSADAAAVLRAVRRANAELTHAVDWASVAARLGADVPVCVANRLSFMRGIGERVELLPALTEPLAAVLVNPQVAVADDKTARVFRALAAAPLSAGAVEETPELKTVSDVMAEMRRTGNALEAAARSVMPVIDDVLEALRALDGCRVAAMSGAGPTCFALVEDAEAAAAQLRAQKRDWWVMPVTLA